MNEYSQELKYIAALRFFFLGFGSNTRDLAGTNE